MTDNHEDVLGAEALEEAAFPNGESSTSIRQGRLPETSIQAGVDGDDVFEADENTSLLSPEDQIRKRQIYDRSGKNLEPTISETWTRTHETNKLPWYKTPSIFWFLPAFFPYCIAFGGIIVPQTYLILDMLCRDYLSDKSAKDPNFHYLPVIFGEADNPQCKDYHVQRKVAWFNTYSDLLSGIFSAIITPHLGALSDRVGRKKVIIWASLGGLVKEIVTIVVGTHAETISVYWILLGSLADGLAGSYTAAMALAFAFASDCSSPERRAVSFGYFQGTLFTGVALGPIVAGYLIKQTGTVMVVFYFALACHLFFLLFTLFFVPESLSKERQMLAREKHAQRRAETADRTWWQAIKKYNLFQPLWVLRPTGEGSSPELRRNLFVLAAIDTMMFGVAMGTMRIILNYANFRYGWNAVDASVYLTVANVCRVTGLIVLLPLLNWIFRGSAQPASGHRGSDRVDIGIIRGAIVFDLVGYLGYALAPTGAVMILSGLIASIGGIGSPTLASSITKHIPAHMSGQVLGASGLLHALARVVAPTVFNLIYGITVQYYAGIVFLALASIFIIVFVLSWFLKPHVYLKDPSTLPSDDNTTEAEH